MTPQEVLLGAADYLEEHGWCQGVMKDKQGRCCANGAMFEVSVRGAPEEPKEYFFEAQELLMDYTGTRTVSNWNDAEDRTVEEVVSTLRKVALLELD